MEMLNLGIPSHISGDAGPCGPDLEYDPAFLELERSVRGKPEVQYGNTVTPAVPPDWKAVRQLAADLLARSRDLRVAVPLARALLALEGIAGFARGLQAIEWLLAEHWDDVHPQLDPDDGADPTPRINCLLALTDGTTVLRELHDVPFVQLPGLGPLALRQLDWATGDVPVPAGQAALAPASIDAAVRDVPAQLLSQAHAAAAQACDSVANIEATLGRRVGSAQALNLEPLLRPLARMRDWLHGRVPGVPAQPAATAAAAGEQGASRGAPVQGLAGTVCSRADVVQALDLLLAYYALQEPSSPVPLLLERAKRLVPKTFMEIMEDLAPDSVGQLLVIRGPQPE